MELSAQTVTSTNHHLVGVLNLTHRNGHSVDQISSLNLGERYRVQLDFNVVGYTVLAGHQLRVALSQSYWPWGIWPPPSTSTLQLHFASPPVLALPLRQRGEDINSKDAEFSDLGRPVVNPHKLPVKEIRKSSIQRSVVRMLNMHMSIESPPPSPTPERGLTAFYLISEGNHVKSSINLGDTGGGGFS